MLARTYDVVRTKELKWRKKLQKKDKNLQDEEIGP